MFQRFNKAGICCPAVVYEEINAMERKRPKNDKKPKKFPHIQRFYAIFANFSKYFVD